jgi:predicted nucleotidyltransferase
MGVDAMGKEKRTLLDLTVNLRNRAMRLTASEQQWLDSYREALAAHPGTVERMLVYGSKARGDACPDSDLDILLIVANPCASLKRPLRRIGYFLAAATDVVPSIMAYTRGEWEQRKRSGSSFRRAVERDGVRVL